MIRDGKEFTKLEGFIGARYASVAGESAEVCRAIENHYYPRSATGNLPGDRVSSTLSVADRLDNVTGCWVAGFAPTGAKDPYALRRHALAILRILLDLGIRIDLEAALAEAMAQVAPLSPEGDAVVARDEIHDFVRTRMAGYFTENLGCSPEAVRAVLPVRWQDPLDALAWTNALAGYRDREDFQLLATGFKRCRNILKGDILPVGGLDKCLERWLAGGSGSGGEDFSDLSEPAEMELRDQVKMAVPRLAQAEKDGDYDQVFAVFSGLGPAIDVFFEMVRVNVEDQNRISPGNSRSICSFRRFQPGGAPGLGGVLEAAPRPQYSGPLVGLSLFFAQILLTRIPIYGKVTQRLTDKSSHLLRCAVPVFHSHFDQSLDTLFTRHYGSASFEGGLAR